MTMESGWEFDYQEIEGGITLEVWGRHTNNPKGELTESQKAILERLHAVISEGIEKVLEVPGLRITEGPPWEPERPRRRRR
jgi:hypothetical protein